MEPHPCLDEEMSTTFRKTYLHPLGRSKPNIVQRKAGWDIEFDGKMKDSYRVGTLASGFQVNADKSWLTEKNLHADIKKTEYRFRYNQDKPFHKTLLTNSHGRKNPAERFRVYDKDENNHNTNWEKQAKVYT